MRKYLKTTLSAVTVLTASLFLSACDADLTPEQLSPLYGEWITENVFHPHDPQEEIPFLITFNEDGTCYLDDNTSLTWSAKAVKDSSNLEVQIKEDKKILHVFQLNISEERTDGVLLDKKEEKFYSGYQPKNTEVNILHEDLFYTEWSPRGEAGNTIPLIMEKDGICYIDGEKLNWVAQPIHSGDENYQFLSVYNDKATEYVIDLHKNRAGIIDLNLQSCSESQQEWIDSYYCHPLMKETYYHAFDENNPLTYDINIHHETTYFNSVEHAIEISEKTTSDKLIYLVPNAQDPQYEFTVTEEGGFPNLTVTDLSNGENYYYYNPERGYDPNHPEAHYCAARRALTAYAEDDSCYVPEKDDWIDERDLLRYAYENFSQIDGYRDSSDYLSRFVLVEDKLLHTERNRVDNMGNESNDSEYTVYTYDANGRLDSFCDNDYALAYGLSAYGMNGSTRAYITYDTNNQIHKIQLRSYDTVDAECYPVYDEEGKIIRMHLTSNSVESTSAFVYDEDGRLIKLSMADGTLIQNYNEDGTLALSYLLKESQRIRTEYEYENGLLSKTIKRYEESYSEEPWYVTRVYHYDKDGKLLSVDLTSTNEDYDYLSEEFVSVYDDVYYFDECPEDAEPSEPVSSKEPETLEENTTARIIGEWNLYPDSEEFHAANLVFHADGTCILDGEPLTYELKAKSDHYLEVYLLRAGVPIAYFSSSLNSSNINRGYFYSISEEGIEYHASSSVYYRVEDYNIYEITKENFFDFFEVKENIAIEEDTFGGISYVSIEKRYQLKEEYGTVSSDLTDVALEYAYHQIQQECTFDIDTETYELGSILESDYYSDTRVLELHNIYLDDITHYGFSYTYFTIDQFPEDEVYPIEDFVINRIKGTIYTIAQ